MTSISEDTEVKVAVEAAENFANTYYATLNRPNGPKQITEFYVKNNPESPLKPDITINGNIVADPSDLETLFSNQPSRTHYEVEGLDCHVVNTNFSVGAPESLLGANSSGKKMSVLVMVSGSVKFPDEDAHGFTDNLLLVPNWEFSNRRDAKGKKPWLVQSQTFRMVF